ncbi:DUF1295 domain-containing protein [Salsipaludibacter albus]|uniref:DUF1295 domain-containing protein n=1 Tax=Salsipaludibacter albus TaxID=2849650 RepID=UPI001EE483CD
MSFWLAWLTALGTTVAFATLVWIASVVRHDVSLVDRVWGMFFVVQAWTVHLVGQPSDRSLLVAVLVTLWGVRLSAYLTWRNWGEGEDPRYVDMRERSSGNFTIVSLVRVFWLQAVLATLVGMPLVAVATRSGELGWLDLVAVVVWAVGVFFEAVGDWQLARFLADESNRGTVMDRGLWRYTRHPNYFGDSVVWLSFGLFAVAAGAWWALPGPILMWLLIVKVSGVAMTDDRMGSSGSKREGYDEYVARTNAFFPGPRSEVSA